MKIKISPIIKVNQNVNSFFIGTLKLSELIKCATVFTRERSYDKKRYNSFKEDEIRQIIGDKKILEEEIDFGTQRRRSEIKLKKIGKYIQEQDGFFPNSFIVSIDPIKEPEDSDEDSLNKLKFDEIIKVKENSIEFDSEKVQIKIIDGQHRFYGFKYIDEQLLKKISKNFECILTIFINLPNSEQADLFAIVNSTQTPVNKSILIDLKSLSYKKYRKLHVSNAIAKWFNEKVDKKRNLTLWRERIKMLGIGKGLVSQGMFVETISRLISNDLGSRKGILFDLYEKKEYDKIYFLLKDYFSAWEIVFPEEWGNEEFLLCKTVGFVAMIKLFEIFYIDHKNNYEYKFMDFVLDKLNLFKKNETYNNKFFTKFGSSLGEANKIKDEILKVIYNNKDLSNIRKQLRSEKIKIHD